MRNKNVILFEDRPLIKAWASIAGKKESEGPLAEYFDISIKDDMYGTDNWEAAESKLQMEALETALGKSNISKDKLDCVVAGDLLGQLMASSFGVQDENVPFFGVYGACSTMGESMAVASMLINGAYADNVAAVTSSHFATAEKQFRFPLGYGNQRPLSATTTVTGSGAVIIGKDDGRTKEEYGNNIYVEGITIGKIVDYGIKDANNMGAAMAPAAYRVIKDNLCNGYFDVNDYDIIITGDLGMVGSDILYDMFIKDDCDISRVHIDCGNIIYDAKKQDAHSGGSGCGCSAITLCGYILENMREGIWNRVLFVPTGAMLSTVSLHEGDSIPAIAYAIMLTTKSKGR